MALAGIDVTNKLTLVQELDEKGKPVERKFKMATFAIYGTNILRDVMIEATIPVSEADFSPAAAHLCDKNLAYCYCHAIFDPKRQEYVRVVERIHNTLLQVAQSFPRYIRKRKSLISNQFKLNIEEMFAAVSTVHGAGSCLGNLSSDAFLFSRIALKSDFVAKLDIHRASMGPKGVDISPSAIKEDWKALFGILEEVDNITNGALDEPVLDLEFMDLYKNAYDNAKKFGGWTNPIKTFLKHPFFWKTSQQTAILVMFVDDVKVKQPDHSIYRSIEKNKSMILPDVSKKWTDVVNGELLHYMTTNPKASTYRGESTWDYLRFMRNTIDHVDEIPAEITDHLDRTGVITYFHRLQPMLFIALKKLALQTKLHWICSFLN